MSTNQRNIVMLAAMPHGEVMGSLDALTRAIAEVGGDPGEVLGRLRGDSRFANRVAEWAVKGAIPGFTELSRVRDFDLEVFCNLEWMNYLKLNGELVWDQEEYWNLPWTEAQLTSPCPWNQGQTVAQTHRAFFLPRFSAGNELFSIRRLIKALAHKGDLRFYFRPRIDVKHFSGVDPYDMGCRPQWCLVPKEVPDCLIDRQGSLSMRDNDEQLAKRLGDEYEVPLAPELYMAMLIYRAKHKQDLVEDGVGCLSYLDARLNRAFVGKARPIDMIGSDIVIATGGSEPPQQNLFYGTTAILPIRKHGM